VANGNASRAVFYHYDFEDGGAALNVRGRDKLAKLAYMLPSSFSPIVIERTPRTPGLDEQRRSLLVAELSTARFCVPAERVVIGPPIAEGLTGVEAIYVYGNQLGALSAGNAFGVGGYAGTPGLNNQGLSPSTIGNGFNAGGGFTAGH
jgi:hypothetical protein